MNKSYVDEKAASLQPTHSGTATFTATDNKIVMTGIVSALGLEVGDVIQFTSGTDANNAKMRTVESITNVNEIVVNYEHCGSRGNGSLKLSNQSGISCTVKRVAKYYNAPIGLGQARVSVLAFRASGIESTAPIYTNSTNRAIVASAETGCAAAQIVFWKVNGLAEGASSFDASNGYQGNFTVVEAGAPYSFVTMEGNPTLFKWVELR